MATIAIDVRREIDAIDPKIYGNFIEHLGKCIYGGVYDPDASLSDERGFRTDVIDAVKRLNVTNLRWPGGNFASGYHWMDGVGPKDERPRKMDLAWHNVESNQFGTDEFIEYCRVINTEPYICVNMGSGTMDEAQAWVEYCNGDQDSYYANLRRKYGNDKPYNVRYWGLGNEISGDWQIGHKTAEEYAKAAVEFSKVMERTDQEIELVACGSCGSGPKDMEWNRIVVEHLIDHAEYLGIHMYVGNSENNFSEYMGTSVFIENYLKTVNAVIDAAMVHSSRKQRMKLAFDEWNVWYQSQPNQTKERYNLEDALVVSMFLNAFIRNADTVKIANLAQMVNVIAPIITKPDDMFLQTIFYPLELYANHNGNIAIEPYVNCAAYQSQKHGEVPYLDVSASYDSNANLISLNVINRHATDAIKVNIENQHGNLGSEGQSFEINGEEPKVANDFDEPDNVKTIREGFDIGGNTFVYAFPAHSVTMLRLPVT